MSLLTKCLVGFTLLLSTTAVACSASVVAPAAPSARSVECLGTTLRNDDDVAAYAHCRSVHGDLRITNADLIDLSALAGLQSVSGSLVVSGNSKLVSLAGLKGLKRAGAVEISNNRVLSGYFGLLPQLSKVDQQLVLRKNRGLSERDVRKLLERVEQSAASSTLVAQRDLQASQN